MEEAQTSDPKVIVLDVDSGSNTSTAAKDLKEKGSLQINKIERHLSRKRMRRAISLADSTSRKLSCRNTWGLKAYILLLLIAVVAAFYFVVSIQFTGNEEGFFANIERSGTYFFVSFFGVFTLLFLWVIFRWKAFVGKWLIQKNKESVRKPKSKKKKFNLYRAYNENFGLNGRFYLWKLYLYEFIENWIQFINLRRIFLCTLPIEWTTTICVVLMAESLHRSIFMGMHLYLKKDISVEERNAQVIVSIYIFREI